MSTHKLLAPRRIGVCGSSRGLSSEAIQFCQFVGERLAAYATVCVVSGGTRRSSKASEDDLAADWYLVRAAESAIAAITPDALIDRIETVLTEGWRADLSFSVGKTQRARGKTGEARRFSFIRGLDGLIAIGGGSGTAQELALAHELGIPVLPVPWFPGEAAEFWKVYREDLIMALRLDPARASEWEVLTGRDADRLRSVASEMVDTLVASLSRRCL
jgi:predicted Rossmann-fold nucleotide-binding protein